MKFFIYKTLVFCFCIFLLFQLTIGSLIKKYEAKLYNLKSKENIEYVKEKIREEINISLKKEKILKKEDSILLKKFLDKINNELKAKK